MKYKKKKNIRLHFKAFKTFPRRKIMIFTFLEQDKLVNKRP